MKYPRYNEDSKGATGQYAVVNPDYNADDYSGRNLRDVLWISTQPFPEAHFATFPEKLVEPFHNVNPQLHRSALLRPSANVDAASAKCATSARKDGRSQRSYPESPRCSTANTEYPACPGHV